MVCRMQSSSEEKKNWKIFKIKNPIEKTYPGYLGPQTVKIKL